MKKIIRTFEGKIKSESQRLIITEEQWSTFTGNFVVVEQTHGDNSKTEMVYTYNEGKFLLEVLLQIYASKGGKKR